MHMHSRSHSRRGVQMCADRRRPGAKVIGICEGMCEVLHQHVCSSSDHGDKASQGRNAMNSWNIRKDDLYCNES